MKMEYDFYKDYYSAYILRIEFLGYVSTLYSINYTQLNSYI